MGLTAPTSQFRGSLGVHTDDMVVHSDSELSTLV